ncbi:MAG: ATP-binding protein [Chthonomonadales bacterium]|nr:ATP-binding protein [Chthonomonadales bacterium]
MLITFTVENYRSFCDPVTLDMTATRLTSPYPELDTGAVHAITPRLKLLKAAAVFGANASGKSNLIRALSVLKGMVQMSATDMMLGTDLPYEPFRLIAGADRNPSQFEIELAREGVRYRYGFAFDGARIHREWLYRTLKREAALFTRDGDAIQISGAFAEGRTLPKRTRPAALFLSVVAQFNGPIAQEVVGAIADITIVSGLQDAPLFNRVVQTLEDPDLKRRAASLVAAFDTSVRNLRVEAMDPDKAFAGAPDAIKALVRGSGLQRVHSVRTQHALRDSSGAQVGDVEFDLAQQESTGTGLLVSLAPLIVEALEHGRTLAVDEFDGRLHPRLTARIVRMFNSAETNPHGAQLIVATHGVHLLARDTLRRDQVWFVEKDSLERSRLYSLAEFKTRKEDVFERQYLLGRYGAVPIVPNVEDALSVSPAA